MHHTCSDSWSNFDCMHKRDRQTANLQNAAFLEHITKNMHLPPHTKMRTRYKAGTPFYLHKQLSISQHTGNFLCGKLGL
jgi:hypothetical protein